MQGAFDRRREQRRERRLSIRIGAPELSEDLALAGDRGIETGCNAEKVRDRGRVRPNGDRLRGRGGLAEPDTRVHLSRQRREQLDAVARDERERSALGGGRRGSGEALARRNRRVPLMERP